MLLEFSLQLLYRRVLVSEDVREVSGKTRTPSHVTKTSSSSSLGWTVNAFWTFDIGMNFCTGYVEEGNVIMDRRIIARHYVSTWFLFDVVVILPDWVTLMLKTDQNVAVTICTANAEDHTHVAVDALGENETGCRRHP
mmetsp:Transcript_138563/g.276234  ORF Transcript_138563/g.276234 Transcript_138563/m.276234 type:complete len:138 (-) Transcript_138563:589-1002(-)